jgi:hypothetical protein
MKYLLPLIAMLTMACASDKKNDEEISAIKSSMDSLLVEVKSLRKELQEKDSTITNTLIATPNIKKDSVKKEFPKIKPSSPTKKETKVVEAPKNDTTFHYYINGKVSVKIHPWKDSKRTIELFDLYGKLTFSTEDINMSYTIFNHLHFHSNGAVSKIEESNNPGASLYMYKSIMTFSTTNNPELRTNHKWPSTMQDEFESQTKPWFWNKEKMQWVQQEVIECDNPVPTEKQSP